MIDISHFFFGNIDRLHKEDYNQKIVQGKMHNT